MYKLYYSIDDDLDNSGRGNVMLLRGPKCEWSFWNPRSNAYKDYDGVHWEKHKLNHWGVARFKFLKEFKTMKEFKLWFCEEYFLDIL
jgi:hypothetical protein